MARAKRARAALNDKHRRFIAEYLVDLNATQAAIRAGYSPKTARQQGARLLTHAAIAAAIASGKEKQAARLDVTAERVLQELARIAFADLGQAFAEDGSLLPVREMPEDVRRALSSVESDELMEGHGAERVAVGMTRKVRLADKLRGLEMLGKHLRLFGEQQPPTQVPTLIVRVRDESGAVHDERPDADGGPERLPTDADAGAVPPGA